MSVIQETVRGSYGGIPFLVIRSRIEGGRKDVLNEFPNSDLQIIEDLGLRPRNYSLTVVINTDTQNNNYIQRRDTFIRVLEKGGTDILIHPLFGRLDNIVVRTYTLVEDFTNLGEAQFEIVFSISNTTGAPIVSGDTLSVVQTATQTALDTVNAEVGNNFLVSSIFPANFTNAVDKVNSIVEEFEKNTTFLQVAANEIDAFSSELGQLSANVTSLINTPLALATSITNLFETVNGLYVSVQSTFEVVQQFFNFGEEDDDTPIIENTAGRIERARNQNLLNSLVRSQSLIINYSNASQIEFTTVNQVDQVAVLLETQYQLIIMSAEFSSSTIDTITDLRIQVQKFFEDQKLSASQIIQVRTIGQPARALAYQYYGSSELGESIANLNDDLNISFLQGQVDIFTE